MKVLITGANGLLGQKLLFLLGQKPDFEVLATSKGEYRLPILAPNTRYFSLDITQKQDIKKLVDQEKPDLFLNSAALTVVDQCEQNPAFAYQINTEAVRHMSQICAEKGIFFVQISTDFVFDGQKGMYEETDTPNPINEYARTKYEAEKIVMMMPQSWAIVRTILVYGVTVGSKRSNLVEWVMRNLEQKKAIRVVEDQWRTPTLAEDLAAGCLKLIERQKTGIFHIGGKDFCTPYQVALQIAEKFGFDKSLLRPTNAQEFKEIGTRPLRTGLTIQKAQKELGYEPRSLEEGLEIFWKQRK